ncbi:MAG: PorP/SprF family type IX secretion system membrane protein [Bacteroidales bacterium]|nr:PorP/SprF family type IX secretion system membrane protein [Bacteroidales bacterium]
MKKSSLFNIRFIRTLIVFVFVAAFSQLKAQDPIFSQFYNNPIYYNPGYIGLNSGMRARFNYRDQWTGLPTDFKTYNFSMDVAERSIPGSGGLGLLVSSDRAGTGTIKSTNIGIGTAARIPIYTNMVAQMGFMVSYAQKSVNWDELVFSDQLNARYGNIYQTAFENPASNRVSYPDFSVGGVYRFVETGSRWSNIQGTLGAAVHHVFTPNESFQGLNSPLPRKLVITGDLVLEIEQGRSSSYRSKRGSGGSSFKFNPGFQYEKQADFSTYTLGLNILKSSIYFGAWFRNQDFNFFEARDAIFQVGFNAPWSKDSRCKIMYTYDYLITDLRTAGRASHEISLVFEFDNFSLFGGKTSGFNPGYRGSGAREMECCPF